MLIIDRLEGGTAVCEDAGGYVELPLTRIRGPVKEGDILTPDGEHYVVDAAATAERARHMRRKLDRLFARHSNKQ